MKILFSDLSFGRALDSVQDNPDTRGMRLPSWKEDVIIKCQMPDENSKMTAPYLYVESRFGRVPWKETMIEMFSKKWQLVDIREETIDDICKNDKNKVTIENVNKIHKIREQNDVFNQKTLKEKANEIHKECRFSNNCLGCPQECRNKCHKPDKKFKFKKMNGEKVRDDSIDSLTNLIMYLHWLGYDFF